MSNTMKGRHAVGGKTARPGSIRGGQSEPAGNKGGGITGSSTRMQPRPPVLTDQNTSAAVQRIIPRPPMPFENPQGSLNVPAPAHSQFRSDGNARESQKRYGGSSSASIHSSTSLTADEQRSIGGGMPSARGQHSVISGFPTSGGRRQAGMPGTNSKRASGRDNARMRQRPGGF